MMGSADLLLINKANTRGRMETIQGRQRYQPPSYCVDRGLLTQKLRGGWACWTDIQQTQLILPLSGHSPTLRYKEQRQKRENVSMSLFRL